MTPYMREQLDRNKATQEVSLPKICGLSRKERKLEAMIHRRIAFLYQKITGLPCSNLSYEHCELDALEWLLKIAQEHYDLINSEDVNEQMEQNNKR